jgi:hypothetical protein
MDALQASRAADEALRRLHARFVPMTSASFIAFLTECELLEPRRLASPQAALIFSRVKLGTKSELGYDRFTEALRQVAVAKKIAYQDLVEGVLARSADPATVAVEEPGEIEHKVDPASGHPYYVNKVTGKSGWKREEVVRRIPVVGEGVKRATESARARGQEQFLSSTTNIRRAVSGGPGEGGREGSKQGFLKLDHIAKAGSERAGLGWKRRWFVLCDTAMEYFATEDDAYSGRAPLGIIELQADTSLRQGNKAMFQVVAGAQSLAATTQQQREEAQRGGGGKGQRTWVFQASGSLEQEEWLVALRGKIAVLKGEKSDSRKDSIGLGGISRVLDNVGSGIGAAAQPGTAAPLVDAPSSSSASSASSSSSSSAAAAAATGGGGGGGGGGGADATPKSRVAGSARAGETGVAERTEGYLQKKGHVRRNWTRRYFQLDVKQGVLRYFKPTSLLGSEKPKGTILLAGLTVRRAPIFCEFVLVEQRTGRSYALLAESEIELEEWILALESTAKRHTPE